MSFNIILISLESTFSVHTSNAILLIPTTKTNQLPTMPTNELKYKF